MTKFIREFAKDPNPNFKSSTTILIIILLAFSLGFVVLDAFRIANEQSKISTYAKAKNEQEWLQKFSFADNAKLLKLVLAPVKFSDIEKVQLEQISLIKKHNLIIKKIDNGKIKIPDQTKKKDKNNVNYAQTTVTLSGSWENLAALLNSFEKLHLVVITDLKMDFDAKTGLINTSMKYQIYYE